MRTAVIIFLFCVASAWAQYSVPNLDPRVNDLEAVTDALDVRVGAVETGKAALVHGHIVSDVTGLQDALDGKVGTNDTRQLDFTGADVRVADGTDPAHPVTLSQLGARGATNITAGAVVGYDEPTRTLTYVQGIPVPSTSSTGDLLRYDGTNWVASAKTWLDENMVVYFYPTNTQEEIFATIAALPRNLNGKTLYLAWHNGTYNFTENLLVLGFNNGELYWGTTSLTYSTTSVAYTNQPIIFQNNGAFITGGGGAVVRFENCDNLKIFDSRFLYDTAHTNKTACTMISCSAAVFGNRFGGATTNAANLINGMLTQRSVVDFRANYLDNCFAGISIQKASQMSIESSVSGPTRPRYDIRCMNAVANVNQTNLSNIAEFAGLIINQAGAILP